jgi:hypothetical protein
VGIALYRAPGAGDGQRQCWSKCGNGNVTRVACFRVSANPVLYGTAQTVPTYLLPSILSRLYSKRGNHQPPYPFLVMSNYDQQTINEGDIMDIVTTAQERGMAYLWQAVAEQLADLEAMRVHVTMARTLLGAGGTCTRLLK